MKNKDRKIIWALAFILAFSLGSPAQAADNHSHFDAEKVKAGVKWYRAYRTQAEINEDWWTYNQSIPPGDKNAAHYDATLDGAIYPIKWTAEDGPVTTGTLQPGYRDASFNPSITTSGSLWTQWEVYYDQDMIDDWVIVQSDFNSMKTTRWYQPKGQCSADPNEERFFTTQYVGNGAYPNYQRTTSFWVAFSGGCYGQGGETDTKYHPPGDTWLRFTSHVDFAGGVLTVYVTNVSTGQTSTIYHQEGLSFPTPFTVTHWRGQLQSTSRDFDPALLYDYYDWIYGLRNVIASTDRIAFTGSSSTFCGDGSCNGTETCSTCAADCGACKGDLNFDGKVDIFDYSLFISDFGKTGTGLAADLNSDGKVDIFDYSMFISNFGK